MIKYFLLIFLSSSLSESRDFCEVFNFKMNFKYQHCIEKQRVFAYLHHTHYEPNIEYEYNFTYNVKIPKVFELLILNFVEHNCYVKENHVRIKEITNLQTKNKYKTKIIISCIYKS
ncbi:MAG: hypothetical protein ACJ0G4_00605 [Alphaproteobacteria bacterium]